jgi:D-tyrosyl-tRNA(Tyr) deacylase
MRALIQRVSRAQCAEKTAYNKNIASIGRGLLLLVGFEAADSPVSIEQMVQKIKGLRIFPDAKGKMNLSGAEVSAEYLVVSQFTLYADCRYGNRPSFDKAAEKTRAKEYYEHFVKTVSRQMGENLVKHTPFGSDLAVELVNDGPVTIWLDSSGLA